MAIGDPLAALAAAAGDPDPERWWDDVIEHRGDGAPAFDAVAAAMTAVRGGRDATTLREAQREAHMRQVLRRAIADGHERIAVVCGAWHVPALAEPLPTGIDRRAHAARAAQGEGRVELGAVDASPPRFGQRLRGRRAQPRLVRARVQPSRRARVSAAGSSALLGCCATAACRRLPTI